MELGAEEVDWTSIRYSTPVKDPDHCIELSNLHAFPRFKILQPFMICQAPSFESERTAALALIVIYVRSWFDISPTAMFLVLFAAHIRL